MVTRTLLSVTLYVNCLFFLFPGSLEGSLRRPFYLLAIKRNVLCNIYACQMYWPSSVAMTAQWRRCGLTSEEPYEVWLRFLQAQAIFPICVVSMSTGGPIQLHTQRLSVYFPRDLKLTTHLHLEPRLKMTGTIWNLHRPMCLHSVHPDSFTSNLNAFHTL
jgi:hypothetical protein